MSVHDAILRALVPGGLQSRITASDRAKAAKPSRKTLLRKLADKQERERKRGKA